MTERRAKPEPLTGPDPGYELCYECQGRRYCKWCGGQGFDFDLDREVCMFCGGSGHCPICGAAGQLPIPSQPREFL